MIDAYLQIGDIRGFSDSDNGSAFLVMMVL
jgi:hypothetical protein